MKKPALVAVSAYARLRGIDQTTMRRTLMRVGWAGKVDIKKVDKLIAESKDLRYAPGLTAKGAAISFGEANRRERLAKAKMNELKLAQIEGTLVSKAAVEKKVFELQRRNRDAVANIPARISGIVAAESDQAVVFRILTEELQQAMQDLAS